MPRVKKVITDKVIKIEVNTNFRVINYITDSEIYCKCKKCGQEICDNYRNLTYNKFKCRVCELNSKFPNSKILGVNKNQIKIECKNGHVYTQDRRNFLANKGCKQCYLNNKTINSEELIKKFNKIHGDYYNYNLNNYNNLHSKIEIRCKKRHVFLQTASNHLQGKGCPICRESLGERTISNYLNNRNVLFIRQKRFEDCKYLSVLPFDFYLPKSNMVIEYDGIQHFKPLSVFGELEFKKTIIKDEIKNKYCLSNNIKILRISYKENILKKLSINKYIIF